MVLGPPEGMFRLVGPRLYGWCPRGTESIRFLGVWVSQVPKISQILREL